MNLEYKKRKNELEYGFYMLDKFRNFRVEESIVDFNHDIDGRKFDFDDFFKILRSNFILLLYNFIESSVFLFIGAIYEKFEDERITYFEASEEFKKLFIEYKFLDSFKKDSNFNTYKEKVNEIIEEISSKVILKFKISKLSNLSGNIDSKNLRDVCNLHGIILKSSSKSQDPENNKFSLKNIKDERNALAHGRKSFMEVGGSYTVNDLKNYYEEIVLLMDDLLKSVEKFINEEKYKKIK